jgi:hypothetical protein
MLTIREIRYGELNGTGMETVVAHLGVVSWRKHGRTEKNHEVLRRGYSMSLQVSNIVAAE